MGGSTASADCGSPPRVWGRRDRRNAAIQTGRFTPTGVGTAEACRLAESGVSVHPHGCGDGHSGRAGPVAGERFTPTGVGTARNCSHPVRRRTVHPHGCGDGFIFRVSPVSPCGSPPRVWGRLIRRHPIACNYRFTPTGVGTACLGFRRRVTPPVHPHGCGDGFANFGKDNFDLGSPPRVWGRLLAKTLPTGGLRFTPTGVGTAQSQTARTPEVPVHPHGCGDGADRSSGPDSTGGSPPRVWGRQAGDFPGW